MDTNGMRIVEAKAKPGYCLVRVDDDPDAAVYRASDPDKLLKAIEKAERYEDVDGFIFYGDGLRAERIVSMLYAATLIEFALGDSEYEANRVAFFSGIRAARAVCRAARAFRGIR
jgi:hypothetical protein